MQISVVIPALNEASCILDTLQSLQPLRERGHQLILVDGGSEDRTIEIARPYVDKIISFERGRARQMNTGAEESDGDILWFVHADSRVPEDADHLIQKAFDSSSLHWGRFDVRISGSSSLLRIVSYFMNLRSRITGIATGDQGIFIRRSLFESRNGFADIPLMEDVEFSSRLRIFSKPYCIKKVLITSGRRWERHGVVRTVLLMWSLRLAYFIGVPAARLARLYA